MCDIDASLPYIRQPRVRVPVKTHLTDVLFGDMSNRTMYKLDVRHVMEGLTGVTGGLQTKDIALYFLFV